MMRHIAIVREGDSASDFLKLLSVEKPEFFKRGSIVFVGMYTLKRNNEITVLYSLPKYYPKQKCNLENLPEIQKHIKTICRVVEKLRSEGRKFDDEEYLFDPYEQGQSKKAVNRYELAEYIIEDYLQNGLYVKDIIESRKNGPGRTSWGKTVAKLQPVIQNHAPVYLEMMNRYRVIDENDIISLIHANVVKQCLDFLGIPVCNGMEYLETEELEEDLSCYSSTINIRSTYVFKEREINLFKALEAWCETTRYYKNYAGVTCFDRVWEWVNDSVWGNVKAPNSGNPVYCVNNIKYRGRGEAIPDTIRIEKGENQPEVYIYDSKYYCIEHIYGDKSVKGWPANSDIVKQVAYLKLIKSQHVADAFYNSFLLPESLEGCGDDKENFGIPDGQWFSVIGYVEPGAFNLKLDMKPNEEKEKRVGLIIVKPEKIYDMYLSGRKAAYSDVRDTSKYISL